MYTPFCPPFSEMHTILKDAERGRFKLDRFSIDEKEANHYNAMSAFSFSRTNLRSGTYVRLQEIDPSRKLSRLITTDTPDERASCTSIVNYAHGNVLICGDLHNGSLVHSQ